MSFRVIKKLNYLFVALLCVSSLAYAVTPYQVKDIRVEGLQRTDAGTIFNYLPVKVGDTMDDDKATQAIKSLYSTGFFKDVRIEADNGVLLVIVQERPAIAEISFEGNKSFPSDKMKEGLKQIGLSEGLIFDKSTLDRAELEIKRQYLSQGKYAATVKAVTNPLERNRIAIRFEVEEGKASKIRGINIVGIHDFEEEQIREQMKLTTPNWLSWWSKDDQYSKQKLTADIESIRSYYMNRGYLEFNIDSTQVSITPDKQDIYITINITEGPKYTVSDLKVGGEFLMPEEEAKQLISLQVGEYFSRQKVTETTKAINDRLANDGYAFSNVNAIPQVDKEKHTVGFTFFVDPGRRVYVRRINISGNARTRDDVIRRELRQLESSWYGADKIERSKQRMQRLNYFDDVNVETPAVPGTTDQVDLNITVSEKSTGSIQFGAGLSSNEGIVFGITVNQANFLGTGNRVSAQVNTGSINTTYSLSFTDPYFTPDGISRGFDIYRRDVDTSSLSTASYSSSSYGVGVRFGMPLNERDSVSTGITLDKTEIDLDSSSPIRFIKYCGNTVGCNNTSAVLNLTWTHDTRDNVLYPNYGVLQRLSSDIGLPGFDLEYYKVEYKHTWYYDITKDYTLMLNGDLGYGNNYGSRDFPFFKNFYLGGVSTVRGYNNGTIGTKELDNNGNRFAVGGTKKLLTNAEIFFPVPGLNDSKQFRLSTFFDAGAVYGSSEDITTDAIRYSTGLGVSWFSPFGPIKLVFAKALNADKFDDTQVLQFQLGQQF